jgi:DNA-3-methyladenine glycosylase
MKVLPRKFYTRDTVTVAKELLGKKLVHVVRGRRMSGLIVEVEAYLGEKDAAAHTYKGRRTKRNAAMYLAGGHAYVYFVYGMHWCLNAVTGQIDQPQAVLIRALEPVEGIEMMRSRRGLSQITQLTSGPAKLCEAFGIEKLHGGLDLTKKTASRLFIEDTGRPIPRSKIEITPRIGVDYAGEAARWPLRFYVKDNPHVSVKAKAKKG